MQLNFAIVGASDKPLVNKLLYSSFIPEEPLINHLKLPLDPESLWDLDRLVGEKLEKNFTL